MYILHMYMRPSQPRQHICYLQIFYQSFIFFPCHHCFTFAPDNQSAFFFNELSGVSYVSISGTMQCLWFFSDVCLSLNRILLRFVHTVVYINTQFSFCYDLLYFGYCLNMSPKVHVAVPQEIGSGERVIRLLCQVASWEEIDGCF